nr:TPA_asm: NADH dehydrogenase subunit 3 [Pseudomyrmex concolor]
MINFMPLLLIVLTIPAALIFINMVMTKNHKYREKKSPFECGFDPMSNSRTPISSQFFMVGLVFLVFDVEITLLIPLVLMLKTFNMELILSSMFFILILIAGILFEYLEQSIEWKL